MSRHWRPRPDDEIPGMLEDLMDLFPAKERHMADREHLEIIERFRYHPATKVTGPKHEEVRGRFQAVALWVLADIPASRERALALTALQEAMMWSNAAIAIHTKPEPGGDDSA